MKIKLLPQKLKGCLLDLKIHGIPKTILKRRYGVSRSTIGRYDNLFAITQISTEDLSKISPMFLYDSMTAVFDRELINDSEYDYHSAVIKIKETRYLTKRRVWEEDYKIKFPQGRGYSHFCEKLRKSRLTFKSYLRGIHYPGDEMMIDTAGKPLKYLDSNGDVQNAKVFVAVLPCSSKVFYFLIKDETTRSWLTGIAKSLEFFGGVPKTIICDNAKAIIAKSGKMPVLNNAFKLFIDDYGTTATPCDIHSPRQKATVENAVLIYCRYACFRIYSSIFESFESAQQYISIMTHDINIKPMRDYGNQSRYQRFENVEKNALGHLPEYGYVYREELFARVGSDGLFEIKVDNHKYNAPYQYSRKGIRVEIFDDKIEMFDEFLRIGWHQRSFVRGEITRKNEYNHPSARAYYEWSYENECIRLNEAGMPSVSVILDRYCKDYSSQKMRKSFSDGLKVLADNNPNLLEEAAKVIIDGGHKVEIGTLRTHIAFMSKRAKSIDQAYELTHENLRSEDEFEIKEV